MTDDLKELADCGYAIVRNAISDAEIEGLSTILLAVNAEQTLRRGQSSYAARNLFELAPAICGFAKADSIRKLVDSVLGTSAFAVRSILLDKVAGANWKVPLHQDLTIEVCERNDVPGFGPWSVKAGIFHVQPPIDVLEQMLAIRIHLDDCDADNGPLRVVPGSHCHGRLNTDQIHEFQQRHSEIALVVKRGDAILMRPLLVHASSAAETPTHRRVIHLEFAACQLPGGLKWRNAI